jgi:hypothetical protein
MMVAASEPDGTILGRDSIGQATLASTDSPPTISSDLANHFVVRGYESDLSDQTQRIAVERAVLAAAPAHTTYSVQVIQPRLRVGAQGRVGIDAVVAPSYPENPIALGVPPRPGAQIASEPVPPPTVGEASLGTDTRLS